jgi:hypothetical protein
MRFTPIYIVVAACVAGFAWLANRSSDGERGASDPRRTGQPNSASASESASGSALGSDRVSVTAPKQIEDWRALIQAWLFEVERESVGAQLEDAIENSKISADASCDMILDALLADVASGSPMLCRDAAVAAILTRNKRPADAVAVKATKYKLQETSHELHISLQVLLAAWPCFDEVSCRRSLASAVLSLPDDVLWNLLRQRILNEGASGLAAVAAAGMDLAKSTNPRADRLSLVMDAMFSFGGPHDQVMAAVRGGMAGLGESLVAAASDATKGEVAKFGVYGPSMSVWGMALRSFLQGNPSQPDSISSASRRALLHGMLEAPWPSDHGEANAFHRLVLGIVDGCNDPAAVTYLQRVAKHATLSGARIGALTKLGMTQSVSEIEATYSEIVAVDAGAIRDTQLRVGFYAAVDNSRILSPASRSDAIRLFTECLAEQSADAIPYQMFVLEALARNPMSELAWAVEQIMHQPGKPRVSEQASRTLQVLRR